MSLINDALKKAQKQRTGETPSLASMPSVGGETPHRIARRAKPAGFDTLIIRAGVGAGVVLVLTVGGWLVLREKPETGNLKPEGSPSQTAAIAAASPNVGSPLADAPSSSSSPSSSSPSPSSQVSLPGGRPGQTPGGQQASTARSQVSEPPAPAPAFTLPVTPLPAVAQQTAGQTPGGQKPTTASPQASVPAPDPQVSGFRSQVSLPGDRPGQTPGSQQGTTVKPPAPVLTGSDPRVSPFSPVGKPRDESPVALAKGGTSPATEPARPAPKLEPRAIQFIENIKVAGIMARPTDSKVLMNDRVYRIGSLVEVEMGLTLVGITANSLTFEDGNGGRYTRTF